MSNEEKDSIEAIKKAVFKASPKVKALYDEEQQRRGKIEQGRALDRAISVTNRKYER